MNEIELCALFEGHLFAVDGGGPEVLPGPCPGTWWNRFHPSRLAAELDFKDRCNRYREAGWRERPDPDLGDTTILRRTEFWHGASARSIRLMRLVPVARSER